MKYHSFIFALTATILSGCAQEDVTTQTAQGSYLPMHVGNRWKINAENYTEIRDTLRINGERFYYFYSLIGGDIVMQQYLRIDEELRLVERFPGDPDFRYLHADFGAEVGDTFSTIGDGSRNDYRVEVVTKTDSTITFNYQNKQDDYMRYQHTFIRGLGYQEEYERVVLY